MYTLYLSLESNFDYVLAKGENAYAIRTELLATSWILGRVYNGRYKLIDYLTHEHPIATFSSIEELKTNYPELLI
jgi:hypothetical protein